MNLNRQQLCNNEVLCALEKSKELTDKETILHIPSKGIRYISSDLYIELNVYGDTFALLSRTNNTLYVLLDYFDIDCKYNRLIVKDFVDFYEQSIDNLVTYHNV